MDFKVQLKTMDLLAKLIKGDIEKIKPVGYTPQKVAFDDKAIVQPLPRKTPESVGIPSHYIASFYKEVSKYREIDAHGIMILRHGNIISSGCFQPYKEEFWHISHSLCKSITCLAIGVAIDENILSLDDKIVDIFNDKTNFITALRMKDITIRHLLTMSTGVTINEAGAMMVEDWVKAFLESGTGFEAGKEFAYNSMNTYLLSAIIKQKTGRNLSDYLQEHIFTPLGIYNYYWEKCPMGNEKGGWGLNICLEDMAKIGQLYLQKGNWKGKQLISETWIREATSFQISTESDMSKNGYGYQIWMGERAGTYIFNGMLGQNIVVIPDKDMVIATTAGGMELTAASQLMRLIRDYFDCDEFGPAAALEENPREYQELCRVLNCLEFHVPYESQEFPMRKNRGGWQNRPHQANNILRKREFIRKAPKQLHPLPAEAKLLDGKSYQFESPTAGLVPLFIQCMHNNYSIGVKEIAFKIEKQTLYLYWKEEHMNYPIPIGFGRYLYLNIDFHGEVYKIASKGYFFVDEDGTEGIKILICFVETSNAREIKIYFHKDKIAVKFNEMPALTDLIEGLEFLIHPEGVETSKLSLKDLEYAQYKVFKVMKPEIYGAAREEKGKK